jgi:hypothetical protein
MHRRIAFHLVLLLGLAAPGLAQDTKPGRFDLGMTPQEIDSWLSGWPERSKQLEQATQEPLARITSATRLKIIKLLEMETDASQNHYDRTQTGLGEDYGQYYMRLVFFVVKLKDPVAIPALVQVIDVSREVGNAVAAFGLPALEPLLNKVQSHDMLMRFNAVYTLGKLVDVLGSENVNHRDALAKIKIVLLSVCRDDPSGMVRRNAVDAIYGLPEGQDITAALDDVIRTDPAESVRIAARVVVERRRKRN